MKRLSRTPRAPSQLPKCTRRRRLDFYVLAGTAAGVSTLALVPPADAKIVYTKTNVDVFSKSGFLLDLNNDGITDFWFAGFSTFRESFGVSYLFINPELAGNSIWWNNNGKGATALRAGIWVGPKAPFSANFN